MSGNCWCWSLLSPHTGGQLACAGCAPAGLQAQVACPLHPAVSPLRPRVTPQVPPRSGGLTGTPPPSAWPALHFLHPVPRPSSSHDARTGIPAGTQAFSTHCRRQSGGWSMQPSDGRDGSQLHVHSEKTEASHYGAATRCGNQGSSPWLGISRALLPTPGSLRPLRCHSWGSLGDSSLSSSSSSSSCTIWKAPQHLSCGSRPGVAEFLLSWRLPPRRRWNPAGALLEPTLGCQVPELLVVGSVVSEEGCTLGGRPVAP